MRWIRGLLALTLLFVPAPPVAAQQAPLPDYTVDATAYETGTDGLTPLDVARLQSVTDAVITPDGQHIAHTVRVPADPQDENAPARSHLYVYDVAAEVSIPYATRGTARSIAVRPAHGSITFLDQLDDDETTALYEVPLGGGEAQKLFAFETSISAYAWSPDGQRLAFVAQDPVHETPSTELPYQPEIYEENLAYRFAYVADLAGEAEPQRIALDGHVSAVTWSPAGTRIALKVAPTPLVDDFYMGQRPSTSSTPPRWTRWGPLRTRASSGRWPSARTVRSSRSSPGPTFTTPSTAASSSPRPTAARPPRSRLTSPASSSRYTGRMTRRSASSPARA